MKRRDFLATTLAGAAISAVSGCKPRLNPKDEEGTTPQSEPFGCHYTRRFPELARAPSTPGSTFEQSLAELGMSMKDRDPKANGRLLAGYTYFGQLIDHDLTLDITPLDLAHPDVERIQNYRTPFLDLDHVYGGGPTVSPFLYKSNGAPGKERFLIGKTTGCGSSPDDLPRNAHGIAIVPDPRQDENLIIAQLHVAFLKFHNYAMKHLEENEGGGEGTYEEVQDFGPAGGTTFQRARRFVTWHYQYAVVHDFLRAVLKDDEFDNVIKQCNEAPIPRPRTFKLPVEFSAGVFRFGHSLVRNEYNVVNEEHKMVSLACLLALTGPVPMPDKNIPCQPTEIPVPFALPADWKLDWSRFFDMPNSTFGPNRIRKIDCSIAQTLHELRIVDVNKFNSAVVDDSHQFVSPKNVLPVRTLWRGARMGLPSGQDIAKALNIKCSLKDDEITDPCPATQEILDKYNFQRDTPLWYYVLKEAEIRGEGEKLGPLGGRIVGDVIIDALKSDPNSYLSIDPKWTPTIGGLVRGKLSNILHFVKRQESAP